MASWFCSSKNAARGQFVKLVFPGGHVELLDRPVPAAEVMVRHPRFCVARPDVFRDPAGAVAAPDAVLQLGHKYYVVPKSTVRRLQKYSAASHGGGRRRGGDGVSLKRHLAAGSGGQERSYEAGRKKWLTCLRGSEAMEQKQRPWEGVAVSHGSIAETDGEADVEEIKEKGKAPVNGGSPGRRRRRRLASPGNSASYSWQPSLHSITEE